MARIFLCHASEDKAQVREVYHRLRAIDGFEPWLDQEDLLPGQIWEREIPLALQTSDFILIFLSRNSVAKRGYIQREMKLALDAWKELPEGTIHTIPVRIDECEVPESFQLYHWANLFDPNGFDRIVRAIRTEIAKRQEPIPLRRPQPSTSSSPSEAPATTDSFLGPTFTNSIGMEFVLIPAGAFMMGSLDSDTESYFEVKPAHRVTISQPFYLGKYQVTQEQWKAVMGDNPSTYNNNTNRPVEGISWHDVRAFIHKLNEREGSGDYSLPTEAQWEYACRAGTESPQYHHDIDAIAWYKANSNGQPQPVGQKLQNAWGLYDMLGNVWEWCHDGRREYTAEATVDPVGSTGASVNRVIRGGSWLNPAQLIRASVQLWQAPDYRFVHLGFRCARSVRQR